MAISIDWIPTGSVRKITPKEQGNGGFFQSYKAIEGKMEYESYFFIRKK